MLTKFVPDKYQKSIYTINYKKLKREGIKCILFDLDNTLVPTSVDTPDKKLINQINDIKALGFKIIIMSNSPKSRVAPFQKGLLVDAAAFALKPKKDKYEKILKTYKYKEKEVCSIGDQIVTDIFGSNRMGITSIYVNPMGTKDFFATVFNRFLEKKILKRLAKKDLFLKERYYD